MFRKPPFSIGALAAVLFLSAPVIAGDRLVVHEWGTFTSFQNERGNALPYINTDDEPVPSFVHQLGKVYLFRPTDALSQIDFKSYNKGLPYPHPEVTMRLETPVLYFHLPEGQKDVRTVDVDVEFHGGWLTQFFPHADAGVKGSPAKDLNEQELTGKTVGRLSWKGVKVGGQGQGPRTTDRVWTAPRAVDAAPVTSKTESEQFLFYRGVGHVDAPLRVVRDAQDAGTLHILTQQDKASPLAGTNTPITGAWLVDVRPDGATAFREVSGMIIGGKPGQEIATISAVFDEAAHSRDNLARLRGQMKESLQTAGMFADEAEALLNTWELSYFQSPGLRLFFMVPSAWTDHYLPLRLSTPADVSRAMIGRIELVTPGQRAALAKIAQAPAADLKPTIAAMQKLQRDPARAEHYKALASGRGNPADLGVAVPEAYKEFLKLGRFRTALLLERQENKKQSEKIREFYRRLELAGNAAIIQAEAK